MRASERREIATSQAEAFVRQYKIAPPRALFAADQFARAIGLFDKLTVLHAAGSAALADDLVLLHHFLRWGHHGCPTFTLTHSLAAALLLTDCRRVRGEDVEMPFPSFEVILPDGLLSYIGDKREVPAASLIYHEYGVAPAMHRDHAVDVVWKVARGELPFEELERERAVYVGLQSHESTVGLHRSIRGLEPTESVERFLFSETSQADATRVSRGLQYEPLDTAAIQGALRLIVNLSLYLRDLRARGMWSPTDTARGGRKKSKSVQRHRHWSLGQEIKLGRALIDAAKVRVGESRAAWRTESRFTVRGHWRRVRCGEGGQDRRLKFIEPYWKGPVDGARLLRQYEVVP